MSGEVKRTGGCYRWVFMWGSTRYTLSGEPLRSGICHCLDCRKASGSHFTPFGVASFSV